MTPDIKTVENILGYHFKDRNLLTQALTHSSAGEANYERLEFLGDRVLGLVVAEGLYKRFPDEKEGLMAKRFSGLVRRETLADVAVQTRINENIIVSEQERSLGGLENENLLSDIVEAVLGAMYLDGGLAPCQKFVGLAWEPHFNEMKLPPQESKTALQEWAQARGLEPPTYDIIEQEGPDHAPLFTVEARLGSFGAEHAKGPSRRVAEKLAAAAFLKKLTKDTSEIK